MINFVQTFIEKYGKAIALVFLAGAMYARSEFMLNSAIKEIDKLAAAMTHLSEETTTLRIEIACLKTELEFLRRSVEDESFKRLRCAK